ncbi:MAG: hypothetical protein K1X75_09315 [Leptospirales bacterium]|nr:hypothetical protein [Leptospirales bacterium]
MIAAWAGVLRGASYPLGFPSAARFGAAAVPIPGRLQIQFGARFTGFHFAPVGEYPRRVSPGDALAAAQDFPLLSPLPGVVQCDRESEQFVLSVEGQLLSSTATLPPLENMGAPEFLAALDSAGLPALYYRGLQLSTLLRDVCANGGVALLALYDASASLDWKQIWSLRAPQVLSLVEQLRRIFPEIQFVKDGSKLWPTGAGNLAAYSRRLPEAALRRHRAAAYLGPATILAMLDYFFEGRPFYSRQCGVFSQNGRSFAARLPNGLELSSLAAPSGSIPMQCDPLRGEMRGTDVWPSLSIYCEDGIYDSRFVASAMPAAIACSGCDCCETLCPAQCHPIGLIDPLGPSFDAGSCEECSLCSYVCESAIPLGRLAAEARKKAELSPRRWW